MTKAKSLGLDVTTFKISDKNFKEFFRRQKRDKDCVIQVMNFLNLISEEIATVISILVGDVGIMRWQLVEIFSITNPNYLWVFRAFNKGQQGETKFISALDNISPGFCSIVGIDWIGGGAHVFIIGRTLDGNLQIIDPQIQHNYTGEAEIGGYLARGHTVYLLQHTLRGRKPSRSIQRSRSWKKRSSRSGERRR